MRNLVYFGVLSIGMIAHGHAQVAASNPDEQAILQLLEEFGAARRANDRQAISRLYTEDALYFQRNGGEAEGRSSVVDLLFSMPLGASKDKPSSAPPPGAARIVIDGVEAAGQMGFIYGRVCAAEQAQVVCGSRWLLVTRKDVDGKWRIRADIGKDRMDTRTTLGTHSSTTLR